MNSTMSLIEREGGRGPRVKLLSPDFICSEQSRLCRRVLVSGNGQSVGETSPVAQITASQCGL